MTQLQQQIFSYLAANMFDGDSAGKTTMLVHTLLTDVSELMEEFIIEQQVSGN